MAGFSFGTMPRVQTQHGCHRKGRNSQAGTGSSAGELKSLLILRFRYVKSIQNAHTCVRERERERERERANYCFKGIIYNIYVGNLMSWLNYIVSKSSKLIPFEPRYVVSNNVVF